VAHRELSSARFGAPPWYVPGLVTRYRYLPRDATYEPDSPWSGSGRFDDGRRFTLYLADTAVGATAEFLRRHPEFLALQDRIVIQLFELGLEIDNPCLDVRDASGAAHAQIPFERLTSSDDDPAVRYAECRELASDTEAAGGTGIAYPSAAYRGETNLVMFSEQPSAVPWTTLTKTEVPRPTVDAARVQSVTTS
jgi:hypothetical protein